jgi:hypothetical protein
MQRTQRAEYVERQNGRKGLVFSPRRNTGLTLKKAENLSHDRLMIFSKETIHDSFKLLR